MSRLFSVRLSEEDLYFISESIGQNVPCYDDRTALEQVTSDRVNSALVRARSKRGASV